MSEFAVEPETGFAATEEAPVPHEMDVLDSPVGHAMDCAVEHLKWGTALAATMKAIEELEQRVATLENTTPNRVAVSRSGRLVPPSVHEARALAEDLLRAPVRPQRITLADGQARGSQTPD